MSEDDDEVGGSTALDAMAIYLASTLTRRKDSADAYRTACVRRFGQVQVQPA
jgi:hypothetical protein